MNAASDLPRHEHYTNDVDQERRVAQKTLDGSLNDAMEDVRKSLPEFDPLRERLIKRIVVVQRAAEAYEKAMKNFRDCVVMQAFTMGRLEQNESTVFKVASSTPSPPAE